MIFNHFDFGLIELEKIENLISMIFNDFNVGFND